MKKYTIGSEEFTEKAINYMLKEYDVTYNDIKKYKNGEIKGQLWCNYYWNTIETAKEFEIWFKNFINCCAHFIRQFYYWDQTSL